MKYRVVCVALTGGPCGGKSTAKAKIKAYFEPRGWKVILVPEMATLLIEAGINPFNGANPRFQNAILKVQKAFEEAAHDYVADVQQNTLIVFDRGMVDGAAFTPKVIWNSILAEHGFTPLTARDTRYDAVLHLVTAAKGARAFYTLENNKARTETPDQAAERDDLILAAWMGHPHLRVIGNTCTFEEKIDHVLREIAQVLGMPEPIEKERKFLVRIRELPKEIEDTSYTIVQTYLPKAEGSDVQERLRRRGRNDEWMFIKTIKRPVPNDPAARFETESLLSTIEYWQTITQASTIKELTKLRAYACHTVGGKTYYLEIDRFLEIDPHVASQCPSGNWAIIEIETNDEGPLPLPEWAEVIEEVTTKPEWRNEHLARAHLKNPYAV